MENVTSRRSNSVPLSMSERYLQCPCRMASAALVFARWPKSWKIFHSVIGESQAVSNCPPRCSFRAKWTSSLSKWTTHPPFSDFVATSEAGRDLDFPKFKTICFCFFFPSCILVVEASLRKVRTVLSQLSIPCVSELSISPRAAGRVFNLTLSILQNNFPSSFLKIVNLNFSFDCLVIAPHMALQIGASPWRLRLPSC